MSVKLIDFFCIVEHDQRRLLSNKCGRDACRQNGSILDPTDVLAPPGSAQEISLDFIQRNIPANDHPLRIYHG
jgi:hypothetical protein